MMLITNSGEEKKKEGGIKASFLESNLKLYQWMKADGTVKYLQIPTTICP